MSSLLLAIPLLLAAQFAHAGTYSCAVMDRVPADSVIGPRFKRTLPGRKLCYTYDVRHKGSVYCSLIVDPKSPPRKIDGEQVSNYRGILCDEPPPRDWSIPRYEGVLINPDPEELTTTAPVACYTAGLLPDCQVLRPTPVRPTPDWN